MFQNVLYIFQNTQLCNEPTKEAMKYKSRFLSYLTSSFHNLNPTVLICL